MPATLIDIGLNLSHRRFASDRAEVLQRAVEAGVQTMILTGIDLQGSHECLALAQAHPGRLYCTAGVHPHHASEYTPQTTESLRALAQAPEVVAIGECGLDFNRNFSSPEAQEQAFVAQLALAAELNKPLFLHEREAFEREVALLKPWLDKIPAAVVHCFTGTVAEVQVYLDLGLYIGLTGAICDERKPWLQDVVPTIPLERILIETDAPFQTPRDLRPKPRGGRNEPAFLPQIVRRIAALKDCSDAEIAVQTTHNAQKFFTLPRTELVEKG